MERKRGAGGVKKEGVQDTPSVCLPTVSSSGFSVAVLVQWEHKPGGLTRHKYFWLFWYKRKPQPNFKRLLNDVSVSGKGGAIPCGLKCIPPIVSYETKLDGPSLSRLRRQLGPPSDPRPNETPRSWFTRRKSQTSKDEQHLRLNKNRRRTFVVKSLLLSSADARVKVEEADRFGPQSLAWKWLRWHNGWMLKVERRALAYYDLSGQKNVNYWGCPKIEMLVKRLVCFK